MNQIILNLNGREKSQSEILGRIEELQVANKKLIEEKEKLRAQVLFLFLVYVCVFMMSQTQELQQERTLFAQVL